MSKAKKWICIPITCVLLGQCIAFAADSPQIVLSYPDAVATGETIAVTVSLKGNTGLNAVQFTLEFDDTVLDCTNITNGELLQGMMSASNPDAEDGAILAAAAVETKQNDGVLGTFTFTVLDDGNYDFALSNMVLADSDGKEMTVSLDLGTQGAPPETTTPNTDTPSVDDTADDAEEDDTDQKDEPEEPDDQPVDQPTFTDISTHWAEEWIEEAAELELVGGYGNGLFGPEDTLTRGQLITILWRNEGSPAPAKPTTFTDLNPANAYYNDPIAWAEQTGAMNGVGNGKFAPDAPITREQIATILYRMYPLPTGQEKVFYNTFEQAFTDATQVSAYAKEGVYWAIYNEVWCGIDKKTMGTTLYPQRNATRGEVAVMLCGYHDLMEG